MPVRKSLQIWQDIDFVLCILTLDTLSTCSHIDNRLMDILYYEIFRLVMGKLIFNRGILCFETLDMYQYNKKPELAPFMPHFETHPFIYRVQSLKSEPSSWQNQFPNFKESLGFKDDLIRECFHAQSYPGLPLPLQKNDHFFFVLLRILNQGIILDYKYVYLLVYGYEIDMN